jgi:hypothetical protein
MRHVKTLRPAASLVVAFIALFVAMSGFGYAALKLRPNSVRTNNIRAGAVTTDKIADGAVTTPKLAPDAVASTALNAANAANAQNAAKAENATNAQNAAMLGGVPPGGCQQGWIKASAVIDTRAPLTDQPSSVPGFNCASNADDAIRIARSGTGEYELALAGIDSASAIASSALPNTVASATKVQEGSLVVHVWSNTTGALVDGTPFTLVVF